MRNGRAILEGKTVKPIDELLDWARTFEKMDRTVKRDKVGDARISTVFLGLDHGWGDKPLWFETMIFGAPEHDDYQERYETWDEAEAGHAKALALVKSGRGGADV